MRQQHFALTGQNNRTPAPFEQPPANKGFQPLDLHADGRLHAAQPMRRAGKAAGFGHGHKGAEEVEIQVQLGAQALSITFYDNMHHNYSFV